MLKDENALTKDYGLLFDMVNNDPKTLLYHGYHDYSKEPRWRNLVDLDIQEFANFFVSIGLQKNSEYVEMFDYHIIKMRENGIVARFKHKWMYNTDKNDYGMAEAVTLDFENMVFPFMCLVVGIVSAATVLLAEWIVINVMFFKRGTKRGTMLPQT